MDRLPFSFIVLFFYFAIPSNFSQSVHILKECELSEEIAETSGLITLNDGQTFWTINDSGNRPYLYEIDSCGKILRRVWVLNGENIDWEDLSTDHKKYFYISDTGNNSHNRKSVQLYTGYLVDLFSKDTIEVTRMDISFADFPDTKVNFSNRNFDIEAMCYAHHQIHLFTKNQHSIFKGKTLYLALPVEGSEFSLHGGIALHYGQRFIFEFQITGACYSECLATYYWITATELVSWNGNIQSPQYVRYPFQFISQKESICNLGCNRFACTQEENKLLEQPAKLLIFAVVP